MDAGRTSNDRSEQPTPQHFLVREKSDLEAVFRLVYQAYHLRHLVPTSRHGLRILPHQLLSSNWVLATRRRDKVVATLTVVRDGPLGLPMSGTYGREIATLRASHASIAEVTCFAGDMRRGGPLALVELMRRALVFGITQGVSAVTMCVHPKHAGFYRRQLGCSDLGPLRPCAWVCDQPGIALWRPLEPATKVYESGLFRRPPAGELAGTTPQVRPLCPDGVRYFRRILHDSNPLADTGQHRAAA